MNLRCHFIKLFFSGLIIFFGTIGLFLVSFAAFNGSLLQDLSSALLEVEKYENGLMAYKSLSENTRYQISFDNSEGLLEYKNQTKSWIVVLLGYSFVFLTLCGVSLYFYRKWQRRLFLKR
jgi:hypothetical protein